jgi:hypothetical protein
MKPSVVTYHNFSWSCTCTMKTKLATYLGKACWHEEFVVKQLAQAIEKQIKLQEQLTTPPSTSSMIEIHPSHQQTSSSLHRGHQQRSQQLSQ